MPRVLILCLNWIHFLDIIETLPTDAQFGNDEGEEEHQLTLKDNGMGKVLLGCPAFVQVFVCFL